MEVCKDIIKPATGVHGGAYIDLLEQQLCGMTAAPVGAATAFVSHPWGNRESPVYFLDTLAAVETGLKGDDGADMYLWCVPVAHVFSLQSDFALSLA